MPTTEDPAVWIIDLCDRAWDQAADSLRSQGKRLVSHKPNLKPTGRRDAAAESIKNSISAKIYQTSDEMHSRVTHGDLDDDAKVDWSIQFAAGGDYTKARQLVLEAALVTERLLLLYRKNPHPEWQQIQNIRIIHDVDYPDFQRRSVRFTLLRFGEATPINLTQVTT